MQRLLQGVMRSSCTFGGRHWVSRAHWLYPTTVLHLLPIPSGSILRRWKRNWFVLYLDGSLVYYHDETQRDMDGRIHIKYSCRDVRTGRECRGEQSPTSPTPRALSTAVSLLIHALQV